MDVARKKGAGSLFNIDLEEQQTKGVSIGGGRPEPIEALEKMTSTMGLFESEFYKSLASPFTIWKTMRSLCRTMVSGTFR
jgi:hypothetical protein